MKLIIIEEDELYALPSDVSNCLVAQALKRVLGTDHVTIESNHYCIKGDRFTCTNEMNRVVDSFDCGYQLPYPIELEVDVGIHERHGHGEALEPGQTGRSDSLPGVLRADGDVPEQKYRSHAG